MSQDTLKLVQYHPFETILRIIKINNKMGNIEIKEQPRRTKPIFAPRIRTSFHSPLREVLSPNSPYYQNYSPIKYSNGKIAKNSRSRQKTKIEYSTKSPRAYQKQQFNPRLNSYRKQTERKQEQSAEISSENRQKCEQIIKKVRNFNDFLMELKKRLKQDCNGKQDKTSKNREVSMSVKLENERVELEKYKKLVERELSKTHSIENITIQNANNGQKILTIQYENINELISEDKGQQIEIYDKAVSSQQSRQQSNQDHERLLSERLKDISESQMKENIEDIVPLTFNNETKLAQARKLYQIMRKRADQLGRQLEKQQRLSGGSELKDYMEYKERVVKIAQLYSNLQHANKQSIEIQQKIRALIS